MTSSPTPPSPTPPSPSSSAPSSPSGVPAVRPTPWADRAEQAHAVLLREFRPRPWRPGWPGLFRLGAPQPPKRFELGYWWQAQALDALVDAQLRRPTRGGRLRIRAVLLGIRLALKGRIVNDFYDDMSWMALALLRADALGLPTANAARRLWREIAAAWNDTHGGGLAWSRMQPDYKNVPTNATAAVLAARLYRRDGDPELLAWAERLIGWVDETLVDRRTGLVWDGIGRQGDTAVDRDWLFTYTHGVVVGAHAELAALTGSPEHLARARETVDAVLARLATDGILHGEGDGDGALFRGILVRYLALVDDPRVRDVVTRSAEAAWAGRDERGRFGPDWSVRPSGPTSLSAHLSGVFLMEQLARWEHASADPSVVPLPGA